MEKNNLSFTQEVYVCTVLIGDYDFLMPVTQYDYNQNWHYVCFSDKKKKIKGWQFRELPKEISGLSAFLKSRYIKVFCESIIGKPGVYIYIDANIQLEKKFSDLFTKFLNSNLPIGLFMHPDRNNIYEEFYSATRASKIKGVEKIAKNQLEKYKKSSSFAQTNLLFENNIIFKKYKSRELDTLMKQWWAELEKWPTRDQFSLPFVVFKSKIEYQQFNLNKRVDNKYVFIHGHKEKNFRDIHAYMFARRKKIIFKILLFIWQPVHNFLVKLSQL